MKRYVFALLLLSFALCGSPVSAADPAPAAHILLLVRHGHYVAVPDADPRSQMGLSSLGVAQAHMLGPRLAAWPVAIDGFFASPFRRARETALTVAESLGKRVPQIDEDLAECTPPTRRKEVIAGESKADLANCQAQLDRAFAHYFKPAAGKERTDLLVCHGNVIRYLITRALAVDAEAWLEMSVGHASLTVVRVEPDGRMKVIAVGDVGHLPPSLLTGATGDPERSLEPPATRADVR